MQTRRDRRKSSRSPGERYWPSIPLPDYCRNRSSLVRRYSRELVAVRTNLDCGERASAHYEPQRVSGQLLFPSQFQWLSAAGFCELVDAPRTSLREMARRSRANQNRSADSRFNRRRKNFPRKTSRSKNGSPFSRPALRIGFRILQSDLHAALNSNFVSGSIFLRLTLG